MLTVPAPALAYEPLAPSVAAAELPVTVLVGPLLDEGVPQTPVELSRFALVTYRQAVPGALAEVWDDQQKQWLLEGAPVAGSALAFLPDQPSPWQATVVAAGGQDANGASQFAKAAGGFPSYWFRALFSSRAGEVAVSGPSQGVTFGGIADKNLMVLGPGDGEQPDEATEARLLLKSPALQVIGGLVVHRDSPGAQVTLSNAAGAAVVLRPDGSIELSPGPGGTVVVAGDLETDRIVYSPAAGGPKRTLV